jgi:hypothetical protein
MGMKKFGRFLLASSLMLPLLSAGCYQHREWGPGENTHYMQWESETHRNHLEYDRRSKADQNAYWDWRNHHRD